MIKEKDDDYPKGYVETPEDLEGNPTLFVEQLPETLRNGIWDRVEVELVRLQTTKHRSYVLSPQAQVSIARLTEGYHEEGVTGQNTGVDYRVRDRVRRNIRAVLAYVLSVDGDVFFELSRGEETIFKQLLVLNEESRRIERIRTDPQVQVALQDVPHLDRILFYFQKYLTVQPLFDELQIPYGEGDRDISSYNHTLKTVWFSGGETKTKGKGVEKLARRIVFADWLQSDTNWYGRRVDWDISRAAAFVLSNPARNEHSLTGLMRHFILEMLDQEYHDLKARGGFDADARLALYFSDNVGNILTDFADVFGAHSYVRYSEMRESPQAFKTFAQRIVHDESYTSIGRGMGAGLIYEEGTKRDWVWAGVRFLENILLTEEKFDPNRQEGALWKTLTSNRLQMMKEARDVIIAIS